MELVLQRNTILDELAILQGVVEHRTTIPILANILTEAEDGKLRLVATDLDMTIMTECEAKVGQGGRLTLDSRMFQNLVRNLDAAVAWLKGRPYVTGRIGAVGWCFGGGVALSFGLDGAEHEATAIFYGSLIDDPERLAALDHEVYGTFAELDGGIPPEQVEAFAAALDAAGVENDIHVYDGVDHGFWLRVDGDPEARTEPARDAWRRLRAYFTRTLGD